MFEKLQMTNFIIFFFIAFFITAIIGLLSTILNKKTKRNSAKLMSYETGCLPTIDASSSINIHFYIVGIIFLILDIEIVLLFPWTLGLKLLGILGYYKFLFLFVILGLGFVYEWANGALKWIK